MKIMRKLLDNLGSVWNKTPKEVPVMTLEGGAYSKVSIVQGYLYLHTHPFREGLVDKTVISLQELTLEELSNELTALGYPATLTEEGTELKDLKAYVLMEVTDTEFPATLEAFTSPTWKVFYPIYRVLADAEYNVDKALKQLYVTTATGNWLDYWATFFTIKREPNEDDADFIRRFLMWVFNPKTNNIALKELLAYRLKDNAIEVEDDSPGKFKVTVGPKYISDSGDLNRIIREAKAAGIEYFLSYAMEPHSENYPIWVSGNTGTPWENLDEFSWSSSKDLLEEVEEPEESFGVSVEGYLEEEEYPEVSELLLGITHQTSLTEDYPEAEELQLRELLRALEEVYDSLDEEKGIGIQAVDEEEFLLPDSNFSTCFTLCDGELNDAELFGGKNAESLEIFVYKNGNLIKTQTA